MGLWQHLCEAYTANEELLREFYPLSTTTVNNATKPLLVVSLGEEGDIRSIREIPKKGKDEALRSFVVPVTEASLGRTGIEPHPLFDNYAYLKGIGEKSDRYLKELGKHKDLTREFNSVYRYVVKRTLFEDVKKFNLEPKDDTFVLFEVEFPGEVKPRLWENETLMLRWHEYYLGVQEKKALEDESFDVALHNVECELKHLEKEYLLCNDKNQKKIMKEKIQKTKCQVRECKNKGNALKDTPYFCFDMIMGERAVSAISHPKKIVNAVGNAKLISNNDTTNFTYRGKFATSREAFSIGYDSSQRAHQFLRYIVNAQGIKCDSQVIVSFTTVKKTEEKVPLQPPPISDVLWGDLEDCEKLSSDNKVILSTQTGIDFAHALAKALAGYREEPILNGLHDPTLILILDAATTGRLSITFYREMSREDYLERLRAWHETCRWHFHILRKKGVEFNEQAIDYVGAPTIDNIINVVYGRARGSDSGYNKLKKQARETLIRCIFDNSPLPENYLRGAVQRTSAPLANAVVNEKFSKSVFLRSVAVTCALINKSLKDKGKDQYDMSIELNRRDRDYLYGRLLGAADKLEEYALYKKGNERKETAAIRYMQAFSQKPYSVWKTIHDTLDPYIQQVKNSVAFREIQQIHEAFKEASGDFENDAPLSGVYLLSYYNERARIEQLVSDIKNENTEDSK